MISRDKFKSPKFNEIDFYLSVKDLDLELIQEEIKKIQVQVIDQVQDYVNQEYLNFLSLSRDLDFVEEELLEYSKDFYKILDKVQDFDQNLDQSSTEALSVLKKNSDQRIQKEINKYDALIAGIGKIKDVAATDLLKGIVFFKEIRDFELFSVDLPRRETDLDQIKNFLFLEIKKELQKIFTIDVLLNSVQEELVKLCSGVIILDAFDLFSSCFRSGVIESWLSDSLAHRFQALVSSGESGHEVGHEEVKDESLMRIWLEEFLVFVKDRVLPIVGLTDGLFHGRDFSLLTDAVWPALVDQIDQMTNIKNPAHLKEFHENYSACMEFINRFEELYSDENQICRWKSQKSFSDFMKMWQLSVYYQIRIKEIQDTLQKSLGLKTVESKHGVSIKASEVLLNSIQDLWAPHIFLYGLQYRALKATFNFVSLYLNFISDLLKEDPKDTSRSDDTFISSLLILHTDLDLITRPLLALAKSWPIPDNLRDQTITEVERLWKKDSLPVQAEIELKIVNIVFVKCNEVIKQVRIIPSQFRGTQKETPTKPSLFLSGILGPISNFTKTQKSSIVHAITEKITSQVISRYEDTVTETLNSVSNIEAGLRRFKRTKNVSDVSDEDKIRRQLEIDVEEFKRLVAKGYE